MRQIAIFAATILVVGVIAVRMVDQRGHAPPAAMAAQPEPAPTASSNSRSVALSRGDGGHFWTEARIDGRRLDLVVDTGASAIALRASDAARLGIHPAARDYSVKVSTANGVTRAAPVQLGMVEIGNIVVRDVPALVHADDALGVNLLGMTFLSRVRFSHERGKLILEQ
jgi:aspartyl protease family protein